MSVAIELIPFIKDNPLITRKGLVDITGLNQKNIDDRIKALKELNLIKVIKQFDDMRRTFYRVVSV